MDDHAALAHALRAAKGIYCVFVFDRKNVRAVCRATVCTRNAPPGRRSGRVALQAERHWFDRNQTSAYPQLP
jgi:hypothetical protein